MAMVCVLRRTPFSFTDDFNRADSTTTLGGPWIYASYSFTTTPTWGISSNKAYLVASDGDGMAVVDAGTPDVVVTCTFSDSGGGSGAMGNDIGLVLRYQDHNNFLLATGNVLIRVMTGSTTTLGTAGSTINSGDTLVATLSGNSIVITKNGSAWLSVTAGSGDYPTATIFGIMGNDNFNPNARFDDFSITG